MKTLLMIPYLHPKNVGEELIRRLREIVPEQYLAKAFSMKLPESDPRAGQVLATLKQYGLSKYEYGPKSIDSKREFELKFYRAYDESDFEGQELLQLWPDSVVQFDHPRPWTTSIQMRQVKKGLDFARGLHGRPIIASNRARTLLEPPEFKGLIFRAFELTPNARGDDDPEGELDWGVVGGRWWIFESGVRMPPLSPYLTKISGKTGTTAPREAKHTRVCEAGFDDVELHYCRSEVDAMGSFDVAVEWESDDNAQVIVSRRFYEFCKTHNLTCGFKPVRIDEG